MPDPNTWMVIRALGAPRIAPTLDDDRAGEFSVAFDGMLLDVSKTAITPLARDALVALAKARRVPERREAMFAGEIVNASESRPALHTALRNLSGGPVRVGGQDVMPGVREVFARMAAFSGDVRSGAFAAAGGPVTDVLGIGIGGSHLGPEMAALALAPDSDGPRCHFVSNVDGADFADAVARLDPRRTLAIVASKTFATAETMANAAAVRNWLAAAVDDPAAQFAAVSANAERAGEFGIPAERVFGFGDWVGGRYSIWGPVGLPLMISIGEERFRAFLEGGESMDRHFREAPLEQSMPAMLALTGLWHSHACGHPTRAVLPYDQRLARLPAYLQQLEMESNGKGATMEGAPLEWPSGPVVWGEPGTNGQHAFHQLIHQGTQVVPCEFLVAANGRDPGLDAHHATLLANCIAQSEALVRGRTVEEARAVAEAAGYTGEELERQAVHRAFPGERPSTTLIYDCLTPRRLGQIIALYEHRVFVEGTVLGINSFDQWGVELGKELAGEIEALLADPESPVRRDGSTRRLVAFARESRRRAVGD